MTLVELLLILVALPGHAAIWIYLSNRFHALALPQWMVDVVANGCLAVVVLGGLLLASLLVFPRPLVAPSSPWRQALLVYLAACALVTCGPLAWEMWRRWTRRPPAILLGNHTRQLDLAPRLPLGADQSRYGRIATRVPGNDVLRLEVSSKELLLPRLPAALDGLTIAHLSDLHFTRRIPLEWFTHVIDEALAFEAELVVITGDVIDAEACLPWIRQTLGRLRAPLGVLFVLGNHDAEAGADMVRRAMLAEGMIDLGGRWQTIEARGQKLLLAGNELPWIAPAADLSDAPRDAQLRILLAHSPDQIGWARAHGFDLVLAGHTHGGQICLPLLGATVAPSRFGTRYACGVFHEPPCVMHVSRGISGKLPLRFNCPPEVAKLVLRAYG